MQLGMENDLIQKKLLEPHCTVLSAVHAQTAVVMMKMMIFFSGRIIVLAEKSMN